ncbi:MAG: aromatic ring-hydroxylating dioxygenase subunit alpha [Rhodanobacteraceae bacterium]|jgi:choline monooxygenase|nr:aromatic ring-hydroxylating dioxygenase subunit alpha [Rhodanobacteraceae bacterium]
MPLHADLASQPLAHATALPARYYLGEEAARRDRDTVFARSWQLVAHASQVDGAGDHVVATVAGVPLLIVRDADGTLRALHNVCRHRAGPLATCDGRGAKRLRCHYHGWTYALDGQLTSAPEMACAAGFDTAAVRLPQARVAEWRGLVFVALDAAPPLAEILDGIDARLGTDALAGYVFDRRVGYDIDCDWKVYVDNYLEGYHVPHIHPELNRMLDYRSYLTEPARWHSLQWSPLESAGELYGNGEALYYWIWPNTMLNILPDRLQTNRVLPLGSGRCRVEFDFYYPAGGDATRRERDHAFSDVVQHEDVVICEHVQRGLASGSYVAGRLNPLRESGVHHFHELLRAAYRAGIMDGNAGAA